MHRYDSFARAEKVSSRYASKYRNVRSQTPQTLRMLLRCCQVHAASIPLLQYSPSTSKLHLLNPQLQTLHPSHSLTQSSILSLLKPTPPTPPDTRLHPRTHPILPILPVSPFLHQLLHGLHLRLPHLFALIYQFEQNRLRAQVCRCGGDFVREQAALKQAGWRGVARAAGANRGCAGAREVGEGALYTR
jgi:hypothetical protein